MLVHTSARASASRRLSSAFSARAYDSAKATSFAYTRQEREQEVALFVRIWVGSIPHILRHSNLKATRPIVTSVKT